jgi:Protein of unknown function (DUF559)
MTVLQRVQARMGAYLAQREQEWMAALALCDSPIEQLFLAQLLPYFVPWGSGAEPDGRVLASAVSSLTASDVPSCPDETSLLERFGDHLFLRGRSAILAVQVPVLVGERLYRPDFQLLGTSSKIAIELDGHDFHERTKEQARRDRSRDRLFVGDGWKVLRFTGSEVFASPEQCCAQALGILWAGERP